MSFRGKEMEILKKLYDKSKIWFAISWIIAYCVLMSVADTLSVLVGIEKSVTLVLGILLSAVLFLFLRKNGLLAYYGICAPKSSPKAMLYYLPLAVMLSANLWYGVSLNYGILESVLCVLTMLFVGFLEEVIFRGLLFESMREGGEKTAIAVSSLTFGFGHIINLVNGSGAELLPNLLQVLYATSAGFMFVMMYRKSKSQLPGIAAHGVFNALGVFASEASLTPSGQIVSAILLAVITSAYALYFVLTEKKESKDGE